MKIVDRFTIRDKRSEKIIRDIDTMIDVLSNSNKLDKALFVEINMAFLELLIEAFKRLDDNSTPAKTLLDYTGAEVRDACLRVGLARHFDEDYNYVIAVLQELTKK